MKSPLTPSSSTLLNSIQQPLVLNLIKVFGDMKNATGNLASIYESQLALYLSFLCHSPTPEAFDQGDVSEFYHSLINQIQSELSTTTMILGRRMTPAVLDLCRGSVGRWSSCTKCGYKSETEQFPFLEFPLMFPSSKVFAHHYIDASTRQSVWKVSEPDVMDCLLFSLASYAGERKVEPCPICGGSDSIKKRCNLSLLPQLFVLNLTSAFTDFALSRKKDRRQMILLEQFQMPTLMHASEASYSLSGVIMHHGKTSLTGHYSCYSLRYNGWMYFNDADVRDLSRFPTQQIIDQVCDDNKNSQPCFAYYLQKN